MQPQSVGGAAHALACSPASTADVPLLRHPGDDIGRDRLARLGLPRVLIVAEAAPPPPSLDLVEDWVRAPAAATEIEDRRILVLARYERRTRGVRVDGDGLLRAGGAWVALSGLQRAVMVPLVGHLGRPVRRAVIADEYRAAGGTSARALVSLLSRLRPRVAALGLELHVLRSAAVAVTPFMDARPP